MRHDRFNLLLTTDTVGGVWTYAVELARALKPHGVRIALATMGAPLRPDQRVQVEPLDNVRLSESGYRLEWMPASSMCSITPMMMA